MTPHNSYPEVSRGLFFATLLMDPKPFLTMRSSGILCDCTIQIGNRELLVHGLVIASRSDYFLKLLQSKMRDTNRVDLSNVVGGYDAISVIVDFCYGISVQDRLDESNIAHVLCCALYLQMCGEKNLAMICRNTLKMLTERQLTNCLAILNDCTDIGVAAEKEGVIEECLQAAVLHFKSQEGNYEFEALDDLSNSVNLKDFPIHWIEQILEKMRQEECHLSITAFVSTVHISSIISCYPNSCQTVENSPYSLDACRPSAASPTTLLEAFETIMSYVPDEASTLSPRAASPTWFAKALEFSTTHSLACASRLFSMCASIYDKLANADDENTVVYKFKPNTIVELNNVTKTNHSNLADYVEKMSDRYLLVQAQHQSLTPSDFVQVLQSTDWFNRESTDAPFAALNEMLEIPQDVMKINEDEIAHMAANIDFTKLSQDMLERAAKDTRIPRQVVVMAAVSVCSTLRSQLAITSKAVNDEKKKTEMFKSALDIANQRIRLLKAKKTNTTD